MRHPLHAALLTGLLLTLVSGGALAQAQEQELSAGELRLTPDTGLHAPGTPSTTAPTAPTALPRAAELPPPVQTGLPPSVLAALQRAQVPAAAMSALVLPVGGPGAARVRFNTEQPVNPASVMKLVTTYAAMDLLGPDFTWSTRFYTDGVVDRGTLRGNLYIKGGGDPKLVLERIQGAFQALQNLGVVVVLGDMVLDNSAFDLPPRDPGAFDGEALRPYNAGPDALLVNFKSVVLKFFPDPAAGVARVFSEPPMAGLAVDATLPLTRSGGCGDWRGAIGARFDDVNAIRFTGRYPVGCGDKEWPVAYQDPASYAARALEGLWRNSGGALTGKVVMGATPARARLLHEARSLPLSEIIADVNQWSNNVMAQQLFLTLGQLAPARVDSMTVPRGRLTPERQGRLERSREIVARWWRTTFGIRHTVPVMENGSGLSRIERITPEALGDLLQHAARHPRGATFVQSLSVAGVKGTAARVGREPGSPAYGNAWLKTGTLRDVTGIAGYVNAGNGGRYVVVGFINHPNAMAARPALDTLVEWTAALPD
ncbi:D-alanyl-D-alanine carboxypeptidase/D-alanyl-D-alanine endopeptidase [Hydrogenophaga pseudoflava]|uniref:D-alanyl-D-alanine carboxypeptidase/D-alanyl-D-alanine endopeptidase n=1 Tax=Hydrogenophaga pseudoflava TaxID=47421 RepID=UPI0008268E59|nr:D-alanyl-D-alanine carboxypeptidase/D-alanyl-D-alanine-endopeptidase [Hydrogenophaga pseudoflava]